MRFGSNFTLALNYDKIPGYAKSSKRVFRLDESARFGKSEFKQRNKVVLMPWIKCCGINYRPDMYDPAKPDNPQNTCHNKHEESEQ